MLKIATSTLRKRFPHVHIDGIKLTDEILPFADASIDVVTMNSALHHIPNPQLILLEIARILRPGGLLFIGHEPNIRFVKQIFFTVHASLIHALTPKRIIVKICRFLHLFRPTDTQQLDHVTLQVNEQLKKSGMIVESLTKGEIAQLVDIHSPAAGGAWREVGFDPWNLPREANGSFSLEKVETYNHLGKISGRYRWLRLYEKFLQYVAPRSGSSFFLVAQKRSVTLPS